MARHRIFGFDRKEYDRQYHQIRKDRWRQEPLDRECPADRILGNHAMVQLLSVKLETEGEEATAEFLETLGCSDVGKVMKAIACQ
jgi:hypothetical protein